MPRPVFPVVRLPYDRPDRVARVLDAIRHELNAAAGCARRPAAMTARVMNAARGEPEKNAPQAVAVQAAAVCSSVAAADAVDHVTVGVRDCTLTPKAPRPEITVTAGGAARNAYLDGPQNRGRRPAPADDDDTNCGGPYLLVPPVNVTAEISRPPLTPRYTATS